LANSLFGLAGLVQRHFILQFVKDMIYKSALALLFFHLPVKSTGKHIHGS